MLASRSIAELVKNMDLILPILASEVHLSQSRAGILQQHLKVGLEPSTSLRSGLEGRLLSTEAVVTTGGLVRGTIRLGRRVSVSLVHGTDFVIRHTSPPGLTQTKASTRLLPVLVVGRGPKPAP
jgi:hypothetical protein